MRVIAGKYRSRPLKGPGAQRLRPTSDRLRETLFNVLGPSVEDSLFVDLFAGTGAVGIEAISQAARLIRENLKSLDILAGVELIEAAALRGLEKMATRRLLADFIFLDPPYEKTNELLEILEFLDTSRLVAPRGIVIVEHYWRTSMPARLERLECTRQLEQGDAILSFFTLAAAA
jgi:16S rRNA (guanine966-N2)-methyltransferase